MAAGARRTKASGVARILVALGLLGAWPTALRAQAGQQTADPVGVIELRYTPTARAQIAIWLEHDDGTFVETLRLTEATAYRGIGNRPGASQMNSGYRWPYGRREGVLPVWARRRAQAPGALAFPRVIFQDRAEGRASRTTADHSVDDYFCLSFAKANSGRDALDAMSCASVFSSDKGRYLTSDDVDEGYAEPYESPAAAASMMARLPLTSLYPPRMDVTRCEAGTTGAGCFDHADVADFARDARRVMPEIDAVTMATPLGASPQSELLSVPPHWPAGRYRIWFEINVEGDYYDGFDPERYPTPLGPSGQWDSWASSFGYPYRGQPSVVFALPIELGRQGMASYAVERAVGRSSWEVWGDDYGGLEDVGDLSDGQGQRGSGADRLLRGADGSRLEAVVEVFGEVGSAAPSVVPQGAAGEPAAGGDAEQSVDEAGGADAAGETPDSEPAADGVVRGPPDAADDSENGAPVRRETEAAPKKVRALSLRREDSVAHGHEWLHMSFEAPESELPIHRYEVRVAKRAIVDAETFLRHGLPAKQATTDAEGATRLTLPTDVPAGETIEATIGDLTAETAYVVAVRAVDRRNRPGPIGVAEISTPERRFTTVTPCFVASVAYDSPLATEVSALRRVRDRHLQSNVLGRAFVDLYYERGPGAAAWLLRHPTLRRWTRAGLDGLLSLF